MAKQRLVACTRTDRVVIDEECMNDLNMHIKIVCYQNKMLLQDFKKIFGN